MKRDMELIRQIALRIEQGEDGWAPTKLDIPGYTETQVGYHALLMVEGGLVVGSDITSFGGSPSALVQRLTWTGHEFLDAAREPTRWEQTKALLGRAGGAAFPVWIEALTKAATSSIGLS
jgi:hypothetical protein